MLGNDGGELEVGGAVVDEGVGVTHRAVVDVAGFEGDGLTVEEDVTGAAGYEHNFGVVHVCVESDGGTGNEPSFHYFVKAVSVHTHIELFLAALEGGNSLFLNVFKIYLHIQIIKQYC